MSVLGGKSCKVGELRDQLKKLNQSTKGKKNELTQRLESVRASGAAVGAKQKRQRLSGEGEEDEERVAVWEEAAKKTTKEKDDDDKEEEEEEGGGKEEENTNRPKTDTAMGEAAQILVRQRVSKRGRSDHVTADEEAQDEELANANRGLPGEGSSDEEEEEDASDDEEEKDASDDHSGRKKFVLRVFPVLASRFAPLLAMPKKLQLSAWREIVVDENMTYMLLVEQIAKCIPQTTTQKFQAATTIKFGEGHTIMQSHHSGGEEWQEMEIKVGFGPDSNFQLPANVSIRLSRSRRRSRNQLMTSLPHCSSVTFGTLRHQLTHFPT